VDIETAMAIRNAAYKAADKAYASAIAAADIAHNAECYNASRVRRAANEATLKAFSDALDMRSRTERSQ